MKILDFRYMKIHIFATTTRFSSVLSCEDLLISSLHQSANIWNIWSFLKFAVFHANQVHVSKLCLKECFPWSNIYLVRTWLITPSIFLCSLPRFVPKFGPFGLEEKTGKTLGTVFCGWLVSFLFTSLYLEAKVMKFNMTIFG